MEKGKTGKAKKTGFALEKLKSQKAVIEARIQKAEAIVKTKARKQDLQRKVLVGEYYLEQAAKNGTLAELRAIMREAVRREIDKVLFED